MAVAGLGLFLLMVLVIVGLRSVLQRCSTGDSGIRGGLFDPSFGTREWFAAWMLFFAVLCAVAAPLAELAGLDPFTSSREIRGTGVAVALLGIVLAFLSELNLGDEWRIGVDPDESTDLVTGGAYGVVRNPIFSTMIVTGVGLALVVPNPVSVAGVVLMIAAIQLQVRAVEEPHLARLHGETYRHYTRRVGRFVPLIGRSSH